MRLDEVKTLTDLDTWRQQALATCLWSPGTRAYAEYVEGIMDTYWERKTEMMKKAVAGFDG